MCEGDLQNFVQQINDFIKSVGDHLPALSADNDYLHLEMQSVPTESVISVEEVDHHLHKLDTNKAQDPDSMPSWVPGCSILLVSSVAAIVNTSLREGHVPRSWRFAQISRLPKKQPPEQVKTDLRQISLTAVRSKEMEEFIV